METAYIDIWASGAGRPSPAPLGAGRDRDRRSRWRSTAARSAKPTIETGNFEAMTAGFATPAWLRVPPAVATAGPPEA
jgi:hypothetical protein